MSYGRLLRLYEVGKSLFYNVLRVTSNFFEQRLSKTNTPSSFWPCEINYLKVYRNGFCRDSERDPRQLQQNGQSSWCNHELWENRQ